MTHLPGLISLDVLQDTIAKEVGVGHVEFEITDSAWLLKPEVVQALVAYLGIVKIVSPVPIMNQLIRFRNFKKNKLIRMVYHI